MKSKLSSLTCVIMPK